MVFKLNYLSVSVYYVWEWCKDIWYSNKHLEKITTKHVWEWCKDIWYSNDYDYEATYQKFENDVKIYGIQTQGSGKTLSAGLRMM